MTDVEMRIAVGVRIGRLTALAYEGQFTKSRNHMWRWRCECGQERVIAAADVMRRHTVSCGCLRRDTTKAMKTQHGHARRGQRTAEYRVWRAMITRCHNSKNPDYKDYGGRGIAVCAQWRQSFNAFLMDIGPRPPQMHSIDRINNDGHYEPGNCRWATNATQSINRRSNKKLTFNGETLVASIWAKRLGIKRKVIYDRIKAGWPTERILTQPPKTNQ